MQAGRKARKNTCLLSGKWTTAHPCAARVASYGCFLSRQQITGIEIHDTVKPIEGEVVFQKHFPNSFRDTPLSDHLKTNNINSLVISGMMTNMCVDATVRAAFDYGFKSIVLSDACANRSLFYQDIEIPAQHVHGAFLASLSPIYAKILTVDQFISQAK